MERAKSCGQKLKFLFYITKDARVPTVLRGKKCKTLIAAAFKYCGETLQSAFGSWGHFASKQRIGSKVSFVSLSSLLPVYPEGMYHAY